MIEVGQPPRFRSRFSLLPLMHPLTRQGTIGSVYSWWSDRNPTGPNINLHAAAKPLMKFLYHRAALDFIAGNLGNPLSTEIMDIYSSYLAYKYVSPSTKSAVLKDLQRRVEAEDAACTVADSRALHVVEELLGLPDTEVCRAVCSMLGQLASHESTVPAILSIEPCRRLVSLFGSDEDPQVIYSAAIALSRIARSPEGAQAAVDANVLKFVGNGLNSTYREVRKWTCVLLGALAQHTSISYAILNAKVPMELVFMLRHDEEQNEVIEAAAYALCVIASSPKGAQAALDAKVLRLVEKALDLVPLAEYTWVANRVPLMLGALRMLERLVSHESTVGPVLSLDPCGRVVSLLRLLGYPKLGYNTHLLPESAVFALAKISKYPDGVTAIGATDFLAYASRLMEWPDHKVQLATCIILRNLGQQKPGAVWPESRLRRSVKDDGRLFPTGAVVFFADRRA
ncbi:armadillo-type protein [Mycena latifolia]|nr:armadillo-type protein [Mycena latifolia]